MYDVLIYLILQRIGLLPMLPETNGRCKGPTYILEYLLWSETVTELLVYSQNSLAKPIKSPHQKMGNQKSKAQLPEP